MLIKNAELTAAIEKIDFYLAYVADKTSDKRTMEAELEAENTNFA